MPRKNKKKVAHGKSPSTQAGEFVREEIHHVREGKHGARSAKQAIAIGLSKARKAGVKLPPAPAGSKSGSRSSKSATSRRKGPPSRRRSRAALHALEKESHATTSHAALSRQAHQSAVKRGPAKRRAAAKKAVRTKGAAGMRRAARKAARTRRRAAS